MNIINTEELEKILVANWTAFLQPREILKFTIEQAKTVNIDSPIGNLSISRFELKNYGFLIWIEFSSNQTKGTIEAQITNGSIYPLKITI